MSREPSLACLLALSTLASAAAPRPKGHSVLPAPPLLFTRLTVEDGLSHGHVWSILQDRQGFMWFGTELGGLNRYDGYEFRVYQHDPRNDRSLVHNFVWVLYEDRGGTLWVGTNGGGLDRYDRDTDTFTHHRHDPTDRNSLPHDNVKSLYEDEEGTLWVGSDGGLSRFDREKGTFFTYRHNPADPQSLGDNSVRATLLDGDTGLLWLGTRRGGVSVLDRHTGRFLRFQHDPDDATSLSNNAVNHILQDSSGRLWVSTRGGMNRFDRNTRTFARYRHDPADPASLSDDWVSVVHEGRAGRLWVATLEGLDLLDRKTETFIHYRHDPANPASLGDNDLRTLYEDGVGALWLGTVNGGVNRASDRGNFVAYRHSPDDSGSLSHRSVKAVHVDHAGRLWVGTAQGLNRLGGQLFTRYLNEPHDPKSLSHGDVTALAEDTRGALWVGTYGGGLNRFDGRGFTRYAPNARDPRSLSGGFIEGLHASRTGGLWIGVHGMGLDYFDGRAFTHYRPEPGNPRSLPGYYVAPLHEDPNGTLWLGSTDRGLVRFDPARSSFSHYLLDPRYPDSEAANRVHALHADSSGALWIGADSGLLRFDRASERFTHRYTRSDGLPANTVLGVLGDGQGHLWLSTVAGLSRFTPDSGLFRNYDVSDGLQGNHFLVRACGKDAHGQLFFGGSNGLSAFYPERLEDNPHVPPVVLTGFDLFDRPAPVGKADSPLRKAIHVAEDVTLRYGRSVFSVRFAALSYESPGRNRYVYKLEGFDADWRSTDANRRSATYTNLDPGTYVLRVRASNNDGVWNEAGATLRIAVTPAWWQTWWFRSLAAAAVLSLALGAYRLRVSTLRERERRFRALAENAPDVVARLDRDLRYRYVNPAVEEYTGLSAAALIGKTATELGVPASLATPLDQALRQVFDTGVPTIQEFLVPLPRGLRCFESRLVPEQAADGSTTSVLAITRDITERKQAEDQMKASLSEKVVLLQELHHRVKNNLQIISSLLSLQSRAIGDESAREALNESRYRVHSMALVHEKLYQSPDLTRIDTAEYVRSLVFNLSQSYGIERHRIRLAVDIDELQLGIDTAIPCGLLINELVTNALKHAFPRGRAGEVHVELRSQPGARLLLRVRDTGVGVPQDLDLRNAKTLGLQLVNTLVGQLDGTIRFTGDGGTTVEVRFGEVKYRERV